MLDLTLRGVPGEHIPSNLEAIMVLNIEISPLLFFTYLYQLISIISIIQVIDLDN